VARTLAEVFRGGSLTVELSNIGYAFLQDLQKVDQRYLELQAQLAELKAQGLIYATEYWRPDNNGESKYLYLHYPQRAGSRREREYVGSDPEKIENAQAGIARAKKHDELAAEAEQLRQRVETAREHITSAMNVIKGKPAPYRGMW
jgi:uncharacterized protein (DUF2225 family)